MDGSPVIFLINYVICIKEQLVVARFYCYGGLLIQILALNIDRHETDCRGCEIQSIGCV